jgi:hypothetical protein
MASLPVEMDDGDAMLIGSLIISSPSLKAW